jgi:uncharacterized protein YecE (DUF72 family)
MGNRPEIRIGCSGWNYKHWRKIFYPEKLPAKDWFDFYSRSFDTVEINNTFYRLPPANTFMNWEKKAPDHFIYAVKANRYMTHMIKLKSAEGPLERFLEVTLLLKGHLGPILFQLPPNLRYDHERLETFLNLLPSDLLSVFEFRNQSWMNDDVYQLLESKGLTFCVHDMRDLQIPRITTGRAVYVRFHGADRKYSGNYSDQELAEWWDWMQGEVQKGKDLYVYFNNDAQGYAIYNAIRLKEIAGIPTKGTAGIYWSAGF